MEKIMTIEDMIDNIAAGELNQANSTFNTLVQDRVNQAVDQEKIAVAGTMFNGTEEEEEQLEFDLDHEDLDDLDDEDLEDEDLEDWDDEN